METIYIKRQPNPKASGEFHYVVPAVGIRTREGLRLIPHPYGSETTSFDSLEITIEQVHRAGYGAEYEGKRYPLPARQSISKAKPSFRPRHKSALMNIIEQAVPVLLEQLNDNTPTVVASAAFAMGELRETAALPGLIHALSNEDATVRKNVTEALAKIGKPALSGVQNALKDKHWLVRHSALAVLIELIHCNLDLLPEILPEAMPLLKDESWLVRSQAASVFGEAAKIFNELQEKELSASSIQSQL